MNKMNPTRPDPATSGAFVAPPSNGPAAKAKSRGKRSLSDAFEAMPQRKIAPLDKRAVKRARVVAPEPPVKTAPYLPVEIWAAVADHLPLKPLVNLALASRHDFEKFTRYLHAAEQAEAADEAAWSSRIEKADDVACEAPLGDDEAFQRREDVLIGALDATREMGSSGRRRHIIEAVTRSVLDMKTSAAAVGRLLTVSAHAPSDVQASALAAVFDACQSLPAGPQRDDLFDTTLAGFRAIFDTEDAQACRFGVQALHGAAGMASGTTAEAGKLLSVYETIPHKTLWPLGDGKRASRLFPANLGLASGLAGKPTASRDDPAEAFMHPLSHAHLLDASSPESRDSSTTTRALVGDIDVFARVTALIGQAPADQRTSAALTHLGGMPALPLEARTQAILDLVRIIRPLPGLADITTQVPGNVEAALQEIKAVANDYALPRADARRLRIALRGLVDTLLPSIDASIRNGYLD